MEIDYKEEVISIIRGSRYETISFTIAQMIEFLTNSLNVRLCTTEEIETFKNAKSFNKDEHIRSKYKWIYYSPKCDDIYQLGKIQDKKTGELTYLNFNLADNFGVYNTVLLSKVTLYAAEYLFLSWDNDNPIALEIEVMNRFSFEYNPLTYYKAIYEILTYFKY